MGLKDIYEMHRWKLRLALWGAVVTAAGLVVWGKCANDTPLPPWSASAIDNLMLVDLPGCQRVAYQGFTVYYDSAAHLPGCAIYELTLEETRGLYSRPSKFVRDDTVPGCLAPDAYSGSGYERGHLVPAGDLKWSETAIRQSFLMTNICPQDKSLNQGGWNRLEEKVREWVQRDSALIIATGPVIESNLPRFPDGGAIPRLFYKVILAHQSRPMRAIAFVYPNASSGGKLSQYVVSVDSVERLTGIDFFSTLPDDIEQRIESKTALNAFLTSK